MAELIEETDDRLVLRKLFRIIMKGASQDTEHTGEYQAIDPPSKLSFTWISKNTDFKTTLVSVELLQRGDQTELILTHERFPSAERVRQHKGGWSQIADLLSQHFEQGKTIAETRTVARDEAAGTRN